MFPSSKFVKAKERGKYAEKSAIKVTNLKHGAYSLILNSSYYTLVTRGNAFLFL